MAEHSPTGRRIPPDARSLAWEILRQVEDEGAYADALLGRRLSVTTLSTRDQALATRLVYGTLAWQGYLDHVIAAFSRRPPEDLDAPLRVLLRLALFQVCRLNKIPAFAAVDTAVALAKRFRHGAGTSLVNAVLRRAAAEWQRVPLPSPEDDPVGHLAVRLSHPRWLVERWVKRYGVEDTTALLAANNEPAPTVVRVNRRKIETEHLVSKLASAGYAAAATEYSPVGIRLESAGSPEELLGYREGLLSLQGEASQLVGFLLDPQPGQRGLDACAAPGGKTTHLAELMDDRGEILALDPNAHGLDRLRRMARRLGLSIVRSVVADATLWPAARADAVPSATPFDYVLVDAPCSGLGTLRAHPEIKWRRTPQSLGALADAQCRLLLHLADWVRPGGTLVYATCTLMREENEDVIDNLLRQRPDFIVDDPRPWLPSSIRPLIDRDLALQTFPHRQGLDGFFAMRLKRQTGPGRGTR